MFLQFVSTGKPAPLYKKEDPDWTPCLNMGHKKDVTAVDPERHDRNVKRQKVKEHHEVAQSLLSLSQDNDVVEDNNENEKMGLLLQME
jgi:hypothetical protein